jgi:hypothetical protein
MRINLKHTCLLELRIAITAAMKNVLSPISEAKMTPHDLKNPSKKRFVMMMKIRC